MDKRSSTSRTSLLTRLMRAGMAGCLMVAAALPIGAGCLNRPVGEQSPQTTNIFVEQFINAVIDKIDLLFMIDNSISMADKQAFFAEAVPILVNRLIDPICVSEDGSQTQPPPAGGGNCPSGFQREFDAIRDIHIGIVSSSLGSFGGDAAAACSEPEKNDMAHLVGSLPRVTVNTFQGLGFLAWDPDNLYGGTTQAGALITDFTALVAATGEQGCGYEASLEAWYRFLVDPAPYAQLVKANPQAPAGPATNDMGQILLDGEILNQRRAFLRPDSLVAVVMLTDENDCSVAVPGFSWLVSLQNSTLPRSTSQCLSNPNDRCCQSCGSGGISGCPDPTGDAECLKGSYTPDLDPPNLRCFQQKRRFGIDLLFPTSRYAVGLKSPQLCPASPYGDMDCACDFAQNVLRNNDCNVGDPIINPLYQNLETGELATRDPSLVYFAAIVGVPWQDIATDDTRDTPDQLRYMTFQQMNDASPNRWDLIAGDIYSNVPPGDPFMVESIEPRGGTNPITGTAMVGPGPNPLNPINGHEYNVLANDDLQYACIFPLGDKTRDCDAVAEGVGCDCDAMEMVEQAQNPLCQSAGGAFTAQQTHAKGYPGTRHLDALRRYGANSIVASICPKVVSPADATNPNYGYNPAVSAIIDRLKEVLGGRCLPRKLVPENAEDELYEAFEPGQVPCRIVEAVRPHPMTLQCPGVNDVAGRTDTREDPALDKAVRDELRRSTQCDAPGTPTCAEMCLFTIQQSTGGEQQTCQNSEGEVTEFEGYCYIDPLPVEQGGAAVGNEALVADCPASQKRLLRFVGTETPRNNAITFIACSGAAVSQL